MVVLEVVVSITVDADCSAVGVYGGGGSTGTRGLGRDKRWCAGAGIDELLRKIVTVNYLNFNVVNRNYSSIPQKLHCPYKLCNVKLNAQSYNTLTHLYTPWKRQKKKDIFWCFQGAQESTLTEYCAEGVQR